MASEIEELKAQMTQLQQELEAVKRLLSFPTGSATQLTIPPDLTCRSLTVVNESGIERADIRVDTNDNAVMRIYDSKGELTAIVTSTDDGGIITISGRDGKPKIGLGVQDNRGWIDIYGHDGKLCQVRICAVRNGGNVVIWDDSGKVQTSIEVSDEGGFMRLHGNQGEPKVFIGSDDKGGCVAVVDNDGHVNGRLP
jgi:hypothetical protein